MKRFRIILCLFVLMGVSWVMEIVSFWVGGSAYIWIPTDILNILTGVFVFVIFVCKRRIWKSLKNRIPSLNNLDNCCRPSNTDLATSNTKMTCDFKRN